MFWMRLGEMIVLSGNDFHHLSLYTMTWSELWWEHACFSCYQDYMELNTSLVLP